MKKVKCFLAVLMLSSVMLLGCGDSAEKVESDSDQCVVVQVPDGSTVEELFTFKQKPKWHCRTWKTIVQRYIE